MANYISINIAPELFCLLAALVYLLKDKSPAWKSSIGFLLLTVVMEEVGRHFRLTDQKENNKLVYNLLTLPEAIFISGMFYTVLKIYMKAGAVIVAGLTLIYALYLYEFVRNGPYAYMNTTITVMSVIFSLYGFVYLYLFIKNEAYVELKTHAAFWWVTGALTYYFGGLAVSLLFAVLPNTDDISTALYTYISMPLNFILYGLWSYSFRCRCQQTQ